MLIKSPKLSQTDSKIVLNFFKADHTNLTITQSSFKNFCNLTKALQSSCALSKLVQNLLETVSSLFQDVQTKSTAFRSNLLNDLDDFKVPLSNFLAVHYIPKLFEVVTVLCRPISIFYLFRIVLNV